MEIRKATAEDIPAMAELYERARASLRDRGVDQWQRGGPGADSALADIGAGRAHVVTENGRVIATAAVYVGHEPTYDLIYGGKWETNGGEYGIIHRIAVAPEAKNRGVASMIMDYCADLARAAGAASARCDTHADNVPMRRTLEKNGYLYRGVILLEGGDERVAYERAIN